MKIFPLLAGLFTLILFTSNALADCGKSLSGNQGPSGSYQDTCSTSIEIDGVIYALCDGCGHTFSMINLKDVENTCATFDISNDDGKLRQECRSDRYIDTSFVDSSSCEWEMTSSGQLSIGCGKGQASFDLSTLTQSCPNGISNDSGEVVCR